MFKPVLNFSARHLFRQACELFVYHANFALALETVNRGLVHEPNNAQARVLKADILFCLQQDELALQELQQVLAHQPKVLEAYLSLASILEARGQLKAAWQSNQRAFACYNPARHDEMLGLLYEQSANLLIRMKAPAQLRQLLSQARQALSESGFKALQTEVSRLHRAARQYRQEQLSRAQHLNLRVLPGKAS